MDRERDAELRRGGLVRPELLIQGGDGKSLGQWGESGRRGRWGLAGPVETNRAI